MRFRRRFLALAAVVLAAGCGVPTGAAPETLAPTDIPYALASPSPGSAAATSSPAREDRPRVYLVDADDVLVPSGRDVTGTTPAQRVDDLLAQLAAGPTSGERDAEFTTALPPQLRLSATRTEAGTVTVDLSGASEAPAGEQSRRAVGQIVLTATSVPGISAVLLTHDGEPLEAPLPSGELTSAPLTAADYRALLVAPPS
jgi:hypothetical protein